MAFAWLDFALQGTRVFNSYEELYITWVAAVNTFAKVLTPTRGSVYIYIYIYTYVSLLEIEIVSRGQILK